MKICNIIFSFVVKFEFHRKFDYDRRLHVNSQTKVVSFRVHCWNKHGKNKNENCPDLEIRFYVECTLPTDFGSIRNRRNAEVPFTCREKIQPVEPTAPTETFSIISSLTTSTNSTINGK